MSKIDDLSAIVASQGREIAELRARLAARQSPAPARKIIPAPREAGVQIRSAEPVLALPTDDELHRLRAIVDGAYPRLAFVPRNPTYADADAADDWRGFVGAFAYLAQQGRTEKVDTEKALSWHVDGANNWLHERSRSANVNGRSFLAALVAHADISFTRLDDYPSFGLVIGGAGRQYAGAWRRVLAGEVPRPVMQPGPRPAPPSPSQLLIVGTFQPLGSGGRA